MITQIWTYLKPHITGILLVITSLILAYLFVSQTFCNKPEIQTTDKRDSVKSAKITVDSLYVDSLLRVANRIDSMLHYQQWNRNTFNITLQNKKTINGMTNGDTLYKQIMEEYNK